MVEANGTAEGANVAQGTPAPTEPQTLAEALEALAKANESGKNWQRELQKTRDRNKGLARSSAESQAQYVTAFGRLERMVQTALETSLSNESLSEAAREHIKKEMGSLEVQRTKDTEAVRFYGEANEFSEEMEVDWESDPRLDAARQAQKAGNFAEAIRLAYRAVPPVAAASKEDIKAQIKQGVDETLRQRGLVVDTGAPAATGASQRRFTGADLNKTPTITGRTPKERAEQLAESRKRQDAMYDQMKIK